MKIKTLLITVSLAISVAGCSAPEYARTASSNKTAPSKDKTATHGSHDGHDHAADAGRVPAFEKEPKQLPATLSPEAFTGMTRKAYQAVGEIPETIAQLPCYCHCDRGFGHKSLHSCFVDNHAAGCAVCVDEALMAYRLEKEEKLAPEQIRERIIAEYSKKQ